MHFFSMNDDAKAYDFSKQGSDDLLRMTDADGDLILPGAKATFETKFVSQKQTWDSIYGIGVAVPYGYIEYNDIFGRKYVHRYCSLLNMEWDGANIVLTLPVKLTLPCQRSTEEEPKNE